MGIYKRNILDLDCRGALAFVARMTEENKICKTAMQAEVRRCGIAKNKKASK
jgi:hypothetical protein